MSTDTFQTVDITIETGFVEFGFAVALCLCTSCGATTRHVMISAMVSLATHKVSMSNSLRLNQSNDSSALSEVICLSQDQYLHRPGYVNPNTSRKLSISTSFEIIPGGKSRCLDFKTASYRHIETRSRYPDYTGEDSISAVTSRPGCNSLRCEGL